MLGRRGRHAPVALCALLAFFGLATTAHASHFNGLHWQGLNTERTIRVADCVGPRWDAPLRDAVGAWNSSAYIYMKVVPCDQSHRIKVRTVYNTNMGAGKATYSYSGNHFSSATVLLNNARDHDVERGIVCHELGHTLGLDHRAETSSCMLAVLRPSDSNRPDTHDYGALRQGYSHLP